MVRLPVFKKISSFKIFSISKSFFSKDCMKFKSYICKVGVYYTKFDIKKKKRKEIGFPWHSIWHIYPTRSAYQIIKVNFSLWYLSVKHKLECIFFLYICMWYAVCKIYQFSNLHWLAGSQEDTNCYFNVLGLNFIIWKPTLSIADLVHSRAGPDSCCPLWKHRLLHPGKWFPG